MPMMKSSLKTPKYSACPVALRRQRVAFRAVKSMSMDMSVGSDGESLGDCVDFSDCGLGEGASDDGEAGPREAEDEEDEDNGDEVPSGGPSTLQVNEGGDGPTSREGPVSSDGRRRHPGRGSARQGKGRSSRSTRERDAGERRRRSGTDGKDGEQLPIPAPPAIKQERGGDSRSQRRHRSGDRSRGRGRGANGDIGCGRSTEYRPLDIFVKKTSTSLTVDSLSEASHSSRQKQARRDRDRLCLSAAARPVTKDLVGQRQVSESSTPSAKAPLPALQLPVTPTCLPCLGHDGPSSHASRHRSEQADRWQQDRIDLNGCRAQDPEGPRHLMINPHECDARGRCVRHPQVRLRKKKVLGDGWRVLLSACPDCCVDELYRLQGRASGDDGTPSLDGTASLTLSSGSADSALASADRPPAAHENEKRKHADRRRHHKEGRRSPPPLAQTNDKGAFTCAVQMRWADEKGRHGIYNGQINAQLVPHGTGTMVYSHDGSAKEGEWQDGRYRRRQGSGSRKSKSGRGIAAERRLRSGGTARAGDVLPAPENASPEQRRFSRGDAR